MRREMNNRVARDRSMLLEGSVPLFGNRRIPSGVPWDKVFQ
jgi:hypothetical protein